MPDKVEQVAIPLVEERLSVGKREVETCKVRVRTVNDERQVQLDENLLHSIASVERVAMEREIEAPPPIREGGDTVIVPVIEERMVKRLFLVEVVRLTREVRSRRLQEPVNLRTQRIRN
jgi:stress response protein YsnF